MTRDAITLDDNSPSTLPFSAAVRGGEFLYLSGQVALSPADGRLIEGDASAQTRQIIANISRVLDAAGKTLDDVVRVGVYLTSMADYAAMNDVYAASFSKPYPARTAVAVAALPLGAIVEMDVVAR